jgi:hypothetical protein
MAYGRALTAAEWNKAVKTLDHNRIAHLPTGDIIIPWLGTSYKSYSLRSENGNCIICTWDLDRIKEIVC